MNDTNDDDVVTHGTFPLIDRPAPVGQHPNGLFGAVNETLFGPPKPTPTPDPYDVERERRMDRLAEWRIRIDVATHATVLLGLVVLIVLASILLFGVIRAIY